MGESDQGGERTWGEGDHGEEAATSTSLSPLLLLLLLLATAGAVREQNFLGQRLCVQRHEAGASFTKKEKGNGRQTEKL